MSRSASVKTVLFEKKILEMREGKLLNKNRVIYETNTDKLLIYIPNIFNLKDCLKVTSRDIKYHQEELIYIVYLFAIYAIPLSTVREILIGVKILDIIALFPLVLVVFPLSVFNAFLLNGSTKIELSQKSFKIWRKLQLFGFCVSDDTTDIKGIEVNSCRIFTSNGKLKKMCSLMTEKRKYILGRALSQTDAEFLQEEVAKFIKLTSKQ